VPCPRALVRGPPGHGGRRRSGSPSALTMTPAARIIRYMSKCRTYDLDRLATAFGALSNPQRLRILLKLAAHCGTRGCCAMDEAEARCCAGDLGEDLGLAASTVSHHLKELRQAGLMEIERRGRRIECWVSEDALQLLASFLSHPRGTGRRGAAKGAGAGGDDGRRKK